MELLVYRQATMFMTVVLAILFSPVICDNRVAEPITDFRLIWSDPLPASHISQLSIQERHRNGSFGYETYVNKSCVDEYIYVYGYVLNECSSTSSSTSLRYDWCGHGDDGKIYFNLVRFNNIKCAGAPSSNFTYSDSENCDIINGRKPICVADTEAWTSYDLRQHSLVFFNEDSVCEGSFNYWQTEDTECTDHSDCKDANFGKMSKGYCDKPSELHDDNVCFHVGSKINYKGVEYTYEDLLSGKEPECTVPHSPKSRGVQITTTCNKTARVTDNHLLATPTGFRMAYSLKIGDVLFSSYSDEGICGVVSVEKESSDQEYFGLNCVHSEVLVSGLRASTFGDFHILPSWFMAYVGSFLGSTVTSQIGTYIAEWFYT